jgi:hypothetical protein
MRRLELTKAKRWKWCADGMASVRCERGCVNEEEDVVGQALVACKVGV